MADVRTVRGGLSQPFAEMMGFTTKTKPGEGYRITDAPDVPTIFDEQAWRQIERYLTKDRELSPLEVAAREEVMGSFEGMMGTEDAIWASLMEGLETGFRTDVDPLVAQMEQYYREEALPQLAEDYIGTSGLSSTDFGSAMARMASQLATNVGALQVEADEAAAIRRAGLLEAAPAISMETFSGPFAAAAGGQALREQEMALEPGARLWDTYMQMYTASGLDQPQTFVEPPKADRFSQIMSAMSGVGQPMQR